MKCIHALLAAAVFALVPSSIARAEEAGVSAGRVLILGQAQLVAVNDADFSLLGTVRIPVSPTAWWAAQDGSRVSVISQEGLFRVTQPAQLTVIEIGSNLKVLGQGPLEFNYQRLVPTKGGKVAYLLFAGKKGAGEGVPTLLRVDSAVGYSVFRHRVAGASIVELTADETSVLVVDRGEAANEPTRRRRAHLVRLDAATLELRGTLDLPGPCSDAFWNGDHSLLYLLDPGIDAKRPESAVPGRIYVVDPKTAALVANLEVGANPGPISWDPVRSVSYILTGPRKTRDAAVSLKVIDRDRIVKELDLPRVPRSIVPALDRSRFFVLEDGGITIVDGQIEKIEGRIALNKPADQLVFGDPPTRAYVLHHRSDVVSAVDLVERKILAEITIGRTGVKLGLVALAAAGTALSHVQTQMLLGQYAQGEVFTLPSPEPRAYLAPDGKTIYFHNAQTNDLTGIDTATQTVLAKFAAGPFFRPVLGGRYLAAPKPGVMILVDLAERTVLTEIKVPGISYLSPDGRHAYVIGHNLSVLDLETKTLVKSFSNLKFGLGTLVLFVPAEFAVPVQAAPPPSQNVTALSPTEYRPLAGWALPAMDQPGSSRP